MIIIGIDPGKQGGMAFMDEGRNCRTFPLPMIDRKVDVGALQEFILDNYQVFLSSILNRSILVYLEKQQVRGGQRGQALIGENYGRITAVLDLLKLVTKEIPSPTWKKALFPDQKTHGNKEISIQKCLEWGYELPTLRPKGKKLHDGIADAICIAMYGWYDQETP